VKSSVVIDLVAVSPDRTVVLFLLDDLDWADVGGHLVVLEEKLNSYLRFVESGEMYGRPEMEGVAKLGAMAGVRIHVVAKASFPEEARAFFEYVEQTLMAAGIGFVHEVRLADVNV
jgi:hypothetical protein